MTSEKNSDPNDILQQPIAYANLNVRARKATTKLKIFDVGALTQLTAEDLLECKNLGVVTLDHIRKRLAEIGLKLRGD
ncbi:hypothetical protein EBZ39_07690 [bacterium]|nr:hypothetical protein [bacterium]